MRRITIAVTILAVCVGLAEAGTRADLSGDALVNFQATMDLPLMTVGNAGNAADATGHGHVSYDYNIAKFEVTAGQYTEFLNAVAATDTYELYNPVMADPTEWLLGCNIQRSGSPGSYTYAVYDDPGIPGQEWEDRPVNYVDWGAAARFANWVHNGMPTGAQDLTTTEDGSYFLNGAMREDLMAVTRKADATYVIPTEDEWYKASYHKDDGVTGNYFDYPTSSDVAPSNDLIDPDPGNNATSLISSDYTIGNPYYRTEAGEHENSESPYDTFDMAGNVWEWNEAMFYTTSRGLRGGAFDNDTGDMLTTRQWHNYPWTEDRRIGFRIAAVPNPPPWVCWPWAGWRCFDARSRGRRPYWTHQAGGCLRAAARFIRDGYHCSPQSVGRACPVRAWPQGRPLAGPARAVRRPVVQANGPRCISPGQRPGYR